MEQKPPKDPLEGITLEMIVSKLVEHYGWSELGKIIEIRCFNQDPSLKSSLTFLRRTTWARSKVEGLYLKLHFKLAKESLMENIDPTCS